MKYYAILVAGGSGNRLKTSVAKQFLLLGDKPVLMHTIEAFSNCTLRPEILLVLNVQQHDYWKELCNTYNFNIAHRVIAGGAQRFHSVKCGLDSITGEGIVAVHDAVRPLASTELIFKCYKEAEKKGNCIAGITPADSIRRRNNTHTSNAVDRNDFVLVQTPQTFQISLLKECYQIPYNNGFTDDASVVEHAGYEINVIEGERENIKITYPGDLEIAEVLLKKKGVSE